MYETIQTLLDENKEIRSVYEVGCGCGVNLFLFHNRISSLISGGIDFSQSLINTAKKIIVSSDLRCGEASEIEPTPSYDIVMSESVFQYFDSDEYAESVLSKMIEKANELVYVGEISDIQYMDEQLEARRRKIENYDDLYKGLERRFYSREWFREAAEKHQKKILFTESNNTEYVNSKYLFNCYIY